MIPVLVSLLASILGAICGVGGGVIIKPVLDMFQLGSVSAISFLSGCTVLSMSAYSVGRSLFSGEKAVNPRYGTPLAIGAAVGGVAGKQLFSLIRGLFADANTVGAVQAGCLALITVGTLLYTVFKRRIQTKTVRNPVVCAVIGLLLGVLSSFLGIGGGPINLMVLSYFFSMDTKTAAANSLYIILFSQAASLLATVVTASVPEFSWWTLTLMVCGGVAGGIIGRVLNKRLSASMIDRLFILLMIVIIGISISNIFRYIT